MIQEFYTPGDDQDVTRYPPMLSPGQPGHTDAPLAEVMLRDDHLETVKTVH